MRRSCCRFRFVPFLTPEHIGRLRILHSISSQHIGRLCTVTMSAGDASYEDVRQLSESGTGYIFDVRNPEELKGGKIPNSINIPVSQFEAALRMDPESFQKTFHVEKPKPSEENIIMHCMMGKRGAQATAIAASLGYSHTVPRGPQTPPRSPVSVH
uniref:Thiosulfate sulfurtransferase (rhodanese)-like domain containing 1 n=1 Tax=Xenopus tropicalis TaxID=8364 RepID=A0A803K4K5_XENTR